MTEDQTGMSGGSGSDENAESAAAKPSESPMESLADQATQMFSSAEGMVAAGGAIFIIGYVIFDLFFDDFGTGNLELLIAILVLLMPRINRDFVEKFAPLPALMKAGGYALGIFGVFALLNLLDSGSFYDGFGTIVGALVYYAGALIAWLGARSIKS